MIQISLSDQTFTGKILNEILLAIENEKMTVADLIRLRVEQEVDNFNDCAQKENQGFSNEFEETLNKQNKAATPLQRRLADTEKEIYRAWETFKNNQVFITVDNRQVKELDEEILLTESTKVSFIQLTPLVGG